MNAFKDEQDKEVDVSLIGSGVDADNRVTANEESISRMLSAYQKYLNSSDVDSECSGDEIEAYEDDFDELISKFESNNRVGRLKEQHKQLKDGLIEFDKTFDKSFASTSVKVSDFDVDLNSLSLESLFELAGKLVTEIEDKSENYPSLIAKNVKMHLDKVNQSVDGIVAEAKQLISKEDCSDKTRLMNILNLSKTVVELIKSIESKVQTASDLVNTLNIYANLKAEKQ